MADTTPAPVLKGWRTTLWNVGLAAGGAALAYASDHSAEITAALPTQYVGWGMMAIAVVGQILRSVTTTAVGTK